LRRQPPRCAIDTLGSPLKLLRLRHAPDSTGGLQRAANRLSLALVVLIALACWGEGQDPAGSQGEARAVPQHLILVTLDTLRADRIGAYGYARETSPTLDSLAARGVRFDDAFAQAISTPPSHASILTGLNPTTHGLRDLHGQRLSDANETLAEILLAEGFRTAAFVSAVPLRRDQGLDQGFELYDDSFVKAGEEERRASLTNEGVRKWLRYAYIKRRLSEWLRLPDPNPRTFLWVHYFDPHGPYYAPREYRERFGQGAREPWELKDGINGNRVRGGPTVYERADVEMMSDLYDAEIRYVDSAVAELLNMLQEADILKDAIVAVVADHGELLGEHGYYFGHWDVFDETARIPLLLVEPRGRFAGRSVTVPVGTVDIVPTVLAWLGVEAPSALDGFDLTALLEGGALPDREIYTEQIEYFPVRAVRSRDWMLIERGDEKSPPRRRRRVLYRRTTDHESVRAANVRVKRRLVGSLEALTHPSTRRESESIPVSEEVEEQLRALGYTGQEPPRSEVMEGQIEMEENSR
jgi:arylsulfatase A-like enzyme